MLCCCWAIDVTTEGCLVGGGLCSDHESVTFWPGCMLRPTGEILITLVPILAGTGAVRVGRFDLTTRFGSGFITCWGY